MSEFQVRVVRVGPIEKHPNADSLSITQVDGGYPVIFRTGDYKEGDLAVYVPIDAVVPEGDPRWDFLQGHRRIKAKKLRGVFSMGLLTKLPPVPSDVGDSFAPACSSDDCRECHFQWAEGMDLQAVLNIVKYEPVMKGLILGQEHEQDPGFLPVYTDIEGIRKHKNVLSLGEEVVCSEKVHGANARFAYRDGRLWVGSHRKFMRPPQEGKPPCVWWKAALEAGLEEKLQKRPDLGFYGEVFGAVQDLNYGVGQGVEVRFFDAMDLTTQRYLDYDDFVRACDELGLMRVPVIYKGPWKGYEEMRQYAEGKTTLVDDGPSRHVREGYVVRPLKERQERSVGRVILKSVGEGYLLRKDA